MRYPAPMAGQVFACPADTFILRTLLCNRAQLLEHRAPHILHPLMLARQGKFQKALLLRTGSPSPCGWKAGSACQGVLQMNVQLSQVLSDVTVYTVDIAFIKPMVANCTVKNVLCDQLQYILPVVPDSVAFTRWRFCLPKPSSFHGFRNKDLIAQLYPAPPSSP